MFGLIRNMFLMRKIPLKHDTPVAPLGLCRATLLKHDTNGNLGYYTNASY